MSSEDKKVENAEAPIFTVSDTLHDQNWLLSSAARAAASATTLTTSDCLLMSLVVHFASVRCADLHERSEKIFILGLISD